MGHVQESSTDVESAVLVAVFGQPNAVRIGSPGGVKDNPSHNGLISL